MSEILKYISVGEMVAILSFVITGVGAVITVTVGVRKMIDKGMKAVKLDVSEQLKKFEDAENERREERAKSEELRAEEYQDFKKSIWRRMDEIKTTAESRFISREICGLLHQGTANTVNKLEASFGVFEARMSAKIDALTIQVAKLMPSERVGA